MGFGVWGLGFRGRGLFETRVCGLGLRGSGLLREVDESKAYTLNHGFSYTTPLYTTPRGSPPKLRLFRDN